MIDKKTLNCYASLNFRPFVGGTHLNNEGLLH